MAFPIFVTRVKVGKGRDVILVSLESPAGNAAKGEVESVEAMRFVVSLATFAEITELFARTLKTIDPALLKAVAKPGAAALDPDTVASGFAETAPSQQKH